MVVWRKRLGSLSSKAQSSKWCFTGLHISPPEAMNYSMTWIHSYITLGKDYLFISRELVVACGLASDYGCMEAVGVVRITDTPHCLSGYSFTDCRYAASTMLIANELSCTRDIESRSQYWSWGWVRLRGGVASIILRRAPRLKILRTLTEILKISMSLIKISYSPLTLDRR
jgi:hypothetical protein